jgi:selenide,water dikinase
VKEAMYLLVNYSKVPVFKEIHDYIKKCVPGGTLRNWDSYGHITLKMKKTHILCDPQTSGGLLIAVKKEAAQKWNQF